MVVRKYVWSTGRTGHGNNTNAICTSCRRPAYLKPGDTCIIPQHYTGWNARKKQMLRRFHRLQRAAIVAYGGRCACCGFADIEAKIQTKSVLSLDHVNGGGSKDRNFTLIARLAREGYPPGFRVLCRGCNCMIAPGADRCLLHQES